MNAHIDVEKFQRSSGNLKWLPLVAAAFLRQLPQWHADFKAALAAQNRSYQIDLLHKIKGSCYAVAAYSTVEVISKIEAAHAPDRPLAVSALIHQLLLVEADLRVIVANAPAK